MSLQCHATISLTMSAIGRGETCAVPSISHRTSTTLERIKKIDCLQMVSVGYCSMSNLCVSGIIIPLRPAAFLLIQGGESLSPSSYRLLKTKLYLQHDRLLIPRLCW